MYSAIVEAGMVYPRKFQLQAPLLCGHPWSRDTPLFVGWLL